MKIRNKIVGGILAVTVIGAGLFSGCNDMTADIPSFPSQEVGNTVITEETENGLELTAVKLLSEEYVEYGVNTQAESAYTLNVTYKPAYVTNADVSWSVEFVNPNSEWASGKVVTDYITLSGNNNKATVSVNKAFGEQIKITVSSVETPNVKASCVCDYITGVGQVLLNLTYLRSGIIQGAAQNSMAIRINSSTIQKLYMDNLTTGSAKGLTGTYSIDMDVTYGAGTIIPDENAFKSYVQYSFEQYEIFMSALNRYAVKIDSNVMNTRSDIDSENDIFSLYYSAGDEINIDLPFVDFLTSECREFIIQSRDYLWGFTNETPENWDNGTMYGYYATAVSEIYKQLADTEYIIAEMHCDVTGARNAVAFTDYKAELVWYPTWFEIPVASVSTDVADYEF